MYEIEKNIAVPNTLTGPNAKSEMPFDALEVGDSFLVPYANVVDKGKLSRNIACRVWAANSRYRRKSDERVEINGNISTIYKKNEYTRRFISRKTADGVRVWRTE